MPFAPRNVTVNEIDPILNRHLDARYTGTFVSVTGYNPETGDEYRFAVRDELRFCLLAVFMTVDQVADHVVCKTSNEPTDRLSS